MSVRALRGPLLDLTADPFLHPEPSCLRYEPDGLLVLQDGHIAARGPAAALLPAWAGVPVEHLPERLIVPGLIDLHVHYPQTGMIASYGEQLLEWLTRYTFPCEERLQDPAHAAALAGFFLDELLRNGTTCALVFCTSAPASVDALFTAAQARGMRVISGQTLMSRGAPAALLNPPEQALAQVQGQITRWHGVDRLRYALTPRFALTSTREELAAVGALRAAHPDLYLHTHLAESVFEVARVAEDFPEAQDYLDVYDRAGLVGPRAVFAHGIHLEERALARLHQAQAAIAFCPSSNLFLGSGLFPLGRALDPSRPVQVGLGTDVGAGTSFSLLRTMGEAYKVAQLQHERLSPARALWLATGGAARALDLAGQVGTLEPGAEADVLALDPRPTPLLALRTPAGWSRSVEGALDALFAAMILGDERAVAQVWVGGRPRPQATASA